MGDIDSFLTILKSNAHNDAKIKAANSLGRAADLRAVEPLITLLQDSNMNVREAAASALGDLRDLRAIGPLCSILSAYSDGRAAAVALVKIGAPAVELVVSVLMGKPDIIKAREKAAEVLGLIGNVRAVGPLIEAMQFPVSLVGRPAHTALVSIGNPAVPALTSALGAGNIGAASVLIKIGTKEAMDALSTAIKDQSEKVRWAAALALAEVGSVLALEELIGFLKSSNKYTRKSAAEALGNIHDARIINPLIAAIDDADIEVQKAAEGALMSMQIPAEVISLLISQLGDERQRVRYIITSVLSRADKSAVEKLIEALKDSNDNVRKAVARALGAIGDKRAVRPLRSVALGDKVTWVRFEAEAALKKLS